MSLENKAAIVTGSDSGIGRAIALELARQGAAVTINYHKNEDAADAAKTGDRGRRRQSPGHPGRRVERRRHPEARRRHRGGLRAARHPRQQRRDGDPDVDPGHDRAPVRHGHRDRPQERLLRRPAGGEADDRAGWRRPDHQHQLDPRGLADARQLAVLPGQGRRADADPDRRRRARAARDHRRRRRPGRGPHADRRGHPVRPGGEGQARERDPARSRRASPRRSPTSSPSWHRTRPRTAPRRPTRWTAG